MINKIKGAIFDMDGTLVDSLMVWDMLWDYFGEKFLDGEKFRPTEEVDKAIRTMTLKSAMVYLHKLYNIGKDDTELLDTTNKFFADFYINKVKTKTGVVEFLQYLQDKGVKMCIASATAPDLLSLAMKYCDLEKYFCKVFSCGEIGKGKDEPDIYLMALDYLGTSKEETCVFEDSHVAITTADKIGMKTVGLYDKYNYGQEEIRKVATEYIGEGETLKKLIV